MSERRISTQEQFFEEFARYAAGDIDNLSIKQMRKTREGRCLLYTLYGLKDGRPFFKGLYREAIKKTADYLRRTGRPEQAEIFDLEKIPRRNYWPNILHRAIPPSRQNIRKIEIGETYPLEFAHEIGIDPEDASGLTEDGKIKGSSLAERLESLGWLTIQNVADHLNITGASVQQKISQHPEACIIINSDKGYRIIINPESVGLFNPEKNVRYYQHPGSPPDGIAQLDIKGHYPLDFASGILGLRPEDILNLGKEGKLEILPNDLVSGKSLISYLTESGWITPKDIANEFDISKSTVYLKMRKRNKHKELCLVIRDGNKYRYLINPAGAGYFGYKPEGKGREMPKIPEWEIEELRKIVSRNECLTGAQEGRIKECMCLYTKKRRSPTLDEGDFNIYIEREAELGGILVLSMINAISEGKNGERYPWFSEEGALKLDITEIPTNEEIKELADVA